MKVEMAYAQVNGVRYYYQVAGSPSEGEGKPLAMLHGFTGSQSNWKPHARKLAGDFQTIRIDLLGHGRTDAPDDAKRYRMEKSAEDIENLLHRLEPGPVNLLGYSMGGRLALYLAITYPSLVSSLILESASPGLREESQRQERIKRDERLACSMEKDGIEAFVDHWQHLELFTSQSSLPIEIRARLREQRLLNNPAGLANSLRGMGTGAQPSLWPRLGDLNMPVLLLAGELDQKFAAIAGEMALLIGNARAKIVPGAGHTIHMEQPELFDELIKQFLGH
jgi:2-succinyl-6-hydroxy-2,4-cyclohexadiene-1-carboxylate synthase